MYSITFTVEQYGSRRAIPAAQGNVLIVLQDYGCLNAFLFCLHKNKYKIYFPYIDYFYVFQKYVRRKVPIRKLVGSVEVNWKGFRGRTDTVN